MVSISKIKSRYSGFIKNKCSESGCKSELKFTGYPKKIILKADKIETKKKMCDFLVFVVESKIIFIVLELKSKNFSYNSVLEKIQNGTQLMTKITSECIDEIGTFDFFPILLHNHARSPSEIKKLQGTRIIFKEKKRMIICEPRNCELSFIINKY